MVSSSTSDLEFPGSQIGPGIPGIPVGNSGNSHKSPSNRLYKLKNILSTTFVIMSTFVKRLYLKVLICTCMYNIENSSKFPEFPESACLRVPL